MNRMKIRPRILVALASVALALTAAACGDGEIECSADLIYESCEDLNSARVASGSGTQSSATLELCWEQNCDDTPVYP